MSESPSSPENPSSAWLSLVAVLVVQAQNAFNDNFVKLVLIGVAGVVAAGTATGNYIEHILTAMIPLPFILLAPLAGWFSDRYPKNRVTYAALVAKALIFGLLIFALWIRSVPLALFADFLLAVQSTIFSPAKQGILKELVGSKKLGTANGLMQMLAMAGILGGMTVAGTWFDAELGQRNTERGILPGNAWDAAIYVTIVAGLASILPLVLGLFIRRTPEHPEIRFRAAVMWSHFLDLNYLFGHAVLRRTGLFIAFYWFVANFVGLTFFSFAKELHPNLAEGGASSSSARMLAVIGVGLIAGSLFVSFLTRKGNQLLLSVSGGLLMALGMAGLSFLRPEALPWFGAIVMVGFASGFFVVPLSAHLQDQIAEDYRGRVLSAQNLLISFSGIVAIGTSFLMKAAGLSASIQTLVFVPLLIFVSLMLHRMLKSSALKAA